MVPRGPWDQGSAVHVPCSAGAVCFLLRCHRLHPSPFPSAEVSTGQREVSALGGFLPRLLLLAARFPAGVSLGELGRAEHLDSSWAGGCPAGGGFTPQGAFWGAAPRGASPQQHPGLLSPSPQPLRASTPWGQCLDELPRTLLALATLLYPSPGLGGALPTAQPFSRMWSCPGLNHFSFPFFKRKKE